MALFFIVFTFIHSGFILHYTNQNHYHKPFSHIKRYNILTQLFGVARFERGQAYIIAF